MDKRAMQLLWVRIQVWLLFPAFCSLHRIQQQDLDEQALGFDNEVAPTVLETSGRVFRLTGTLESQYGEWRQILREIFRLETGLPGDAG